MGNQPGGVMTNKVWMVGMMLIAFLIGLLSSQNTTQAETQNLSRGDVRRIVEGCSVTGEVYMHSEDYGDIQNARIRC
jgi:hypothetical protein